MCHSLQRLGYLEAVQYYEARLDRLCFECGLTPHIQIKYTSLLKDLVINTIVNLNLQFFQLICNLRDFFHCLYFGPLTNTLWICYPL